MAMFTSIAVALLLLWKDWTVREGGDVRLLEGTAKRGEAVGLGSRAQQGGAEQSVLTVSW